MPLQKLAKFLNPSGEPVIAPGGIQDTSFNRDALSRFVCNTLDEALAAVPGGFDVIVVGSGMYGAYFATDIYNKTKNFGSGRPRPKILVLQEAPIFDSRTFPKPTFGIRRTL